MYHQVKKQPFPRCYQSTHITTARLLTDLSQAKGRVSISQPTSLQTLHFFNCTSSVFVTIFCTQLFFSLQHLLYLRVAWLHWYGMIWLNNNANKVFTVSWSKTWTNQHLIKIHPSFSLSLFLWSIKCQETYLDNISRDEHDFSCLLSCVAIRNILLH